MTEVTEQKADRFARRRVDKFAERRAELASVALRTLSELGIAKTSLRDIAQNSPFSHGVLHYYFTDKIELITWSVKRYKAECVTRYDGVVTTASSPEELKLGFAAEMAATLRDDGPMHRLWYDLRNYSQFNDIFRADVAEIDQSLEQMIFRIVTRYAELANVRPALSCKATYAVFDGLFRNALNAHMGGDQNAASALEHDVLHLLELVTLPATR